jgi:uncharacterized C2H2 Zn-finger protein
LDHPTCKCVKFKPGYLDLFDDVSQFREPLSAAVSVERKAARVIDEGPNAPEGFANQDRKTQKRWFEAIFIQIIRRFPDANDDEIEHALKAAAHELRAAAEEARRDAETLLSEPVFGAFMRLKRNYPRHVARGAKED